MCPIIRSFQAQYVRLADDIANKVGWDDNYSIFVASDSYKTAELLRAITDRPVIDRTQLLKITDGHPMLFANLKNDNAGARCKFEWFLDPFLDLILLVRWPWACSISWMRGDMRRVSEHGAPAPQKRNLVPCPARVCV